MAGKSEQKGIGGFKLLLAWIVALVVVAGLFYGLDIFIMSIQGLPLNADLSPAG